LMGRIERAAEQPDLEPRPMRRQLYLSPLAGREPAPDLIRGRHRRRRVKGTLHRQGTQKEPLTPNLSPFCEERELRASGTHGRIWPVPRTRYLKLVSCSTPTGPRACMRPVAMPISAPKPNSPPSANWVEALCSTIAESTSFKNFSAAAASAV